MEESSLFGTGPFQSLCVVSPHWRGGGVSEKVEHRAEKMASRVAQSQNRDEERESRGKLSKWMEENFERASGEARR